MSKMKRLTRTRALFIFVFVGTAVAVLALWRGSLQNLIKTPTPLARAFRKNANLIENHPAFITLIKAGAKPAQVIEEKSRLGFKRLSLPDLIRWNEIRLRIARANPTLCASLWTGQGATRSDVERTLNDLDAQALDDWAALSLRAAALELENKDFKQPFKEAFETGIRLIVSRLTEIEADRFQRLVYGNGDKALAVDEACWIMVTLLEGTATLPEVLREPFLRSFASHR
jgi:hypothetical protein